MIKVTIHKKDRHHKPLDTLTNKETKIYKAKIRRNMREKEKSMIMVRHINISENILSSVEKIRILNDIINNLNTIHLYSTLLIISYTSYLKFRISYVVVRCPQDI